MLQEVCQRSSQLAIHTNIHTNDVNTLEVVPAHEDRPHVRVRRLEPDHVALGVIPLHGRLTFDHGDDDLARPRGGRLLHEDIITIEDPVFDHRLSDDPEAENLAVATDQDAIDPYRVGRLLDGEDRLSGRDSPEDRHLGHVVTRDHLDDAGSHRAPAQRHDLAAAVRQHRPHRARLQVLPAEMPLLLEGLEVIVHPVGRPYVEVLADLAERGGEPALDDRSGDEIENVPLSLGQRVSHEHRPPVVLNALTVLNTSSPCQFFYCDFATI